MDLLGMRESQTQTQKEAKKCIRNTQEWKIFYIYGGSQRKKLAYK